MTTSGGWTTSCAAHATSVPARISTRPSSPRLDAGWHRQRGARLRSIDRSTLRVTDRQYFIGGAGSLQVSLSAAANRTGTGCTREAREHGR
eukprot:5997974-Pyramimonas_sp.AAC.1